MVQKQNRPWYADPTTAESLFANSLSMDEFPAVHILRNMTSILPIILASLREQERIPRVRFARNTVAPFRHSLQLLNIDACTGVLSGDGRWIITSTEKGRPTRWAGLFVAPRRRGLGVENFIGSRPPQHSIRFSPSRAKICDSWQKRAGRSVHSRQRRTSRRASRTKYCHPSAPAS